MTKRLSKLHKTLFSLLILLLPVQLGKHFWPGWEMINGLRIDYLSPTLYLTDIIIFLILIFWLFEWWRQSNKVTGLQSKLTVFLPLSFLVFLLLNCLFAVNQPAAFYKLFKIIEFFLLGLYISKNGYLLNTKYYLLATVIIYSSLLAIAQFINQGSVGGIWYWLGERTFDAGTPGIALANFNGQLFLRSYATFPHPNVLAGFLVIGLFLLSTKSQKPNHKQNLSTNDQNYKHLEFDEFGIWNLFGTWNLEFGILQWVAFILGIIALFLTFSHVAWLVFGSVIFFRLLRSSRIPKLLKTIIFVFILTTIYYLLTTFPVQSESFSQRQDLNLAAISMIRSSPLTGIGLNNFLTELPKYYSGSGQIRLLQPVHNIFLLAAAETGLIGLISLIGLIGLTIHRLLLTTNYQLLTTLLVVLVLGLFDHYFLTLQSGQLLLTLVLGMAWTRRS